MSQKWVGLYKNVEDTMHEWVVCVGYLKNFSFSLVKFSMEFMGSFLKSIVGLQLYLQFNLLFGILNQLFFDPTRWWGPEVTIFFVYTAKLDRAWITIQVALRDLIPDTWRNEIPPSASFRWNIIWHKHKAQKDTTFV